jgi:MFS transporter, FHS family, L-fucose permease
MKRRYDLVLLVLVTFFVISLLTNILGPLIPDIVQSFELSLTMVAFLPFSFFLAYGIMSIPAGIMIEAWGEKRVMHAAFLIAFTAALLFALFPSYFVAIFSLFFIGIGMAMLQVAINPLLRTSGGEEHFAFNSVLGQLVFGGASFLSPRVYSYLVLNLGTPEAERGLLLPALSKVVPAELPWISLYWIFAAVTLGMILVITASRFPKVERTEEERVGALKTHLDLFKKRLVWLYFLAIFAYVGYEQGVASWISQFLVTYHGADAQTTGAHTVSLFWGLMTVGCILGLVLLKFLDSRRVLMIFSVGAAASLTAALFGNASMALIAFPLVGFFASVMWSVIFSLALNSVREAHGSFSGILCTAIMGGAVLPLVVGWLGDTFGLRFGMTFLYLNLLFIFSIGIWARPIITNKVIVFRRREGAEVS